MLPADFKRITKDAVEVALVRNGHILFPTMPITHCWFPLSGMLSVNNSDNNETEATVGVVGKEGMVDVASLLGDDLAPMRVTVELPGAAVQIDIWRLQDALAHSSTLSRHLLAYTLAFSLQMTSSALAFARYTIDQRLARWMLMCADRTEGTTIWLTHDALAVMLGVRRAGITFSMQRLEEKRAIKSRRGGFSIADRSALISSAGGGYGMAEAQYKRLLPPKNLGAQQFPG